MRSVQCVRIAGGCFFFWRTCACSDGCYYVLGNQQNKTQIMIKAEKFFLFVAFHCWPCWRAVCIVIIIFESRCGARAKIAQGTNSHFILHDEMCDCAPNDSGSSKSTPIYIHHSLTSDQLAQLFIDIEQLQWQRRLCSNFPLQYQNDCIDFVRSLVCKYMHTMHGMVSHVFGFAHRFWHTCHPECEIHTHAHIRAYHIRANYRFVNLFLVPKSKSWALIYQIPNRISSLTRWQYNFLARTAAAEQIVRGKHAVKLKFH